ncbi:uncharacterized protein SCHCODRAFT_02645008 [Schizophyllum commune H4-8]|uniref:uncharacterized protein n=1 Tax=Schizophyllum commune (strain H4-8 / FGSC 9210) TaxID=578458 RepID=UPI00215F167B|nr:uncharacterized protein SCHCODRAFT_02645008 [Schizophyllum commune H4-8]KAI5885068.1 hypothetical protein SCHCODRAFT_02645008 [Schizophyllum commune H4-8]
MSVQGSESRFALLASHCSALGAQALFAVLLSGAVDRGKSSGLSHWLRYAISSSTRSVNEGLAVQPRRTCLYLSLGSG